MNGLLQQHLNRAQHRMKQQADKHRSDRTFEVGDRVFLKLQPYVQSSLAPRANQKLSFKFFGPYTVLSKVGPVAYKLDLPPSSSIHDVFHVSQLKKAVPSSAQVTSSPPACDSALQFPQQILDRKLVSKGVDCSQQVLVKWSGWPESLATWEDLDYLRQQFPLAPAWGQAGSLQGRNVTTTTIVPGQPVVDKPANEQARPRRSSRPKTGNVRIGGPEWIRK